MALLMLMGVACKAPKLAVPNSPVINYKERVVERLVKVPAPADSLTVAALFECNDKNQVILKELNEAKSKRVETGFMFTGNKLSYKAQTKPDVVYLPSKDSIIYKEVAVYVNVPVTTNVLTTWQKGQIHLLRVLLLSLFMYGGYLINKNGILKIFISWLTKKVQK